MTPGNMCMTHGIVVMVVGSASMRGKQMDSPAAA